MRSYLHSYKLLLTALPLLGVLAITACTNPHTPAGSEGYVFENPRLFGEGGYQGIVEGPGNFGVSPWRNQAINIDVRPTTFSEPFQILAQDDLNVAFQIHVVLRVQPGTVQSVVERYSADQWYDRYVKEPFRSFARQAIQAYASHELKTQRPIIAEQIQLNLATYLEGSPFEIINLSIGNIDYPNVVAQAVETRLPTTASDSSAAAGLGRHLLLAQLSGYFLNRLSDISLCYHMWPLAFPLSVPEESGLRRSFLFSSLDGTHGTSALSSKKFAS